MTTFTLQDLNQNLTNEEDEAMDALARLGGGIALGEMFKQMGKDLANHEITHQQAQQNLLNAVPPQPTTGTDVPDLASVLKTLGEQLILLSTVISSFPNQNQPEGKSNASN